MNLRLESSSDREWKKFGDKNPYFGVFTNKRFYKRNLSKSLKKQFFETGADHIEVLFQKIKKYYNKKLFDQGLDFGCGVGRVLIPLSKKCKHVLGLDISQGMLKEATKNINRCKIHNASVQLSSDFSKNKRQFDFIHSFIVFQHIHPKQGLPLFDNLLKKLKNGGIACIHLIISQSKAARLVSFLKQKIPFAAKIANLLKGRKISDPVLQMYRYDICDIKTILGKNKIKNVLVEFTDHGGNIGCIFFIQKDQNIPKSLASRKK